MQVEKVPSQPAHRTVTYRQHDTRCCINPIRPPDDEHSVARNMQRNTTINVLYNVIVHHVGHLPRVRVQRERDGTRAETRFGLPTKRTSPFISAGVSVQSSTGFLGVRVGGERL